MTPKHRADVPVRTTPSTPGKHLPGYQPRHRA